MFQFVTWLVTGIVLLVVLFSLFVWLADLFKAAITDLIRMTKKRGNK